MATWVRRTIYQGPRNGTDSHTVTFEAAEAGNFLLAVLTGPITHSVATGWTAQARALSNTDTTVWTKTATAGENSFTTTHNSSNRPMACVVYEFPAGTTYVGDAEATALLQGEINPAVAGLTGTNFGMACKAFSKFSANGAMTAAWTNAVEDADLDVDPADGTDGYYLTTGYSEDFTGSSFQPTAAVAGANASGFQGITWVVNVPEPDDGSRTGDIAFTTADATVEIDATFSQSDGLYLTTDNATVSGSGTVTNPPSTDPWVNRSFYEGERNGTNTHTVLFTGATAGNLLVAVVAGPVTHAFPGTWEQKVRALSNTDLTVLTKVAAEDEGSLVLTHNSTNRPIAAVVYEFPAGTAWVGQASANSILQGEANPAVTGLSGSLLGMAAKSFSNYAANGTKVAVWTGATEDLDHHVDFAGTDGFHLTIGFTPAYTGSSYQPTATVASPDSGGYQAVTWVLNAPQTFSGNLAVQADDATVEASGSTVRPLGLLIQADDATVAGSGTVGVPPYTSIADENLETAASLASWFTAARAGSLGAALGPHGFATKMTSMAGDTVSFKIHAPSAATLDIYRLGWYGGGHARLVDTRPITVTSQPSNTVDALGMMSCAHWSVNATWDIPPDAVGGVYLAVPRFTSNGEATHIPFVVVNQSQLVDADIVVKTSDATWQAYNHYGNPSGPTTGKSLYGSGGGWNINERSFAVSYDRPLMIAMTGEHRQSRIWNAEMDMWAFLERNGYKVAYVGCDYVRDHPDVFIDKVAVCVGHDEYYSDEMWEALEVARDAGSHAIHAAANNVFWRIRWLEGGRAFACYKDSFGTPATDPVSWTGTFRDDRSGHPSEETLTGHWFIANGIRNDAIEVPEEMHDIPFWRNTLIPSAGGSVSLGDGTAGFEWQTIKGGPGAPVNLVKLAASVINLNGYVANDRGNDYSGFGDYEQSVIIYRHPSGALIWSAGSVQWSWVLGDFHATAGRGTAVSSNDGRQATVNLLADMGVQPETLQLGLVPTTNQHIDYPWPQPIIGLILTTDDAVVSGSGSTAPERVGDLALVTENATVVGAGSTAAPTFGPVVELWYGDNGSWLYRVEMWETDGFTWLRRVDPTEAD